MPRLRKSLLSKSLLVGSIVLPVAIGGWVAQERSARTGAQLFDQVLSLVSDRFVDTVSQSALYEKAARGLVQQLNDPYSEFYTPQQRQRFNTQATGRYGGIGMLIEKQDDNVVVVKVYNNTPGQKAGVIEGDRIIGIDTASTRTWTSQQVSDVLVGIVGTKVNVKFARPGVAQPIEHTFTRAEVHVPAVPYALMLEDKIGYVPLQTFNETAAPELETAVNRLIKQGAHSLIVDLRGNPGGILEQGLGSANLFLKNGQPIATMRARQGESQTWQAQGNGHVQGVPLIVLVDGGSASAAEIVAGAWQDHDRALVVGTTSFGKGLVQTIFPLEGGYAVKLTTAKWYTPSGRSIQKDHKKVDPDAPGGLLPAMKPPTPDSLEKESVKKDRPAFKSDAGRVVYGGGGITPDVIVPYDTVTTPEQEFAKAVAPKAGIWRASLYDVAYGLKGSVSPDFTVKPEWRAELFRRLKAANVPVDQAQFDKAAPFIDRALSDQVAKLAFGDSTAFRRAIPEDSQLEKAIELLKKGQSQTDLFTLAKGSANH